MVMSVLQPFELVPLVMVDLFQLLDLFFQVFLSLVVLLHQVFELDDFVHFLESVEFDLQPFDLTLI